jgi:sarcosine oxidase subunit gamma
LIPKEKDSVADISPILMTERKSALEGHNTAGLFGAQGDGQPGVTLAERRELSIVHVAGNPDNKTFTKAVKTACACALPLDPGMVSQAGNLSLVWLAADRWMAVSSEPAPGVLEDALRKTCQNSAAVIDASHASTVLRISGKQARSVLMKGAPLDFHDRVFIPERAATTIISQCTVVLVCIGQDTFDLYVSRSFALHIWQWLTGAAAEFGYEISDTFSG